MPVLCRAYTAEEQARAAVEGLLAAGVPGTGIMVLMGEPPRDARGERRGSFAEAPGRQAVGDFANHEHGRGAGMGTFAGTAEEQRGGSFADADRETVASYPGGVERRHVAGHRRLRRLLIDAGLDQATAERDVAALHEGRILVLADVGDRSEAQAATAFGD
jgi:hypothetical protein